MPFCQKCGTAVFHADAFCSGCGSPRKEIKERRPMIPDWRIKLGLLAGGAIMLIGTTLFRTSSPPAPLSDAESRVRELRREIDYCQENHSKACVQAKARELYLFYEAVSRKDGVDRTALLDKWREVIKTGVLG
jgi:hypothetical protein